MKKSQNYKELTIKEFTKAARQYDSDNAGIYEMCKQDYPPILEELRHIPFETLLDAGCGTAPMLSLLTREYPDRYFVGLDLTPEMIAKAKAKNLPNTELVVGDCEKLPFEMNTFNVVINSQSLHHYPDPQAFFDSVYRVLKPDGCLILRDNTGPKVLVWLMNKLIMPMCNLAGHGDVGVYHRSEIRKMCEKAGLTVEKIEQQKGFRLHLVARKKIHNEEQSVSDTHWQ